MEHLYGLKTAVDQPRNTIENAKPENVAIEKKQERRSRESVELFLKPAPALGLRAKQRWRQIGAILALEQHAGFPVGVSIMFFNVSRERLDVVVDDGMLQLRRPAFDNNVLVNFHVS